MAQYYQAAVVDGGGAVAVSAGFAEVIAQGYATSGPAIELGRGVHDG